MCINIKKIHVQIIPKNFCKDNFLVMWIKICFLLKRDLNSSNIVLFSVFFILSQLTSLTG